MEQYIIFEAYEAQLIVFPDMKTPTSYEDLVYSIDGSKTYVGWEGETPNCILYQIKTQQGPYTYDELQAILATPEWS
jgi:hypothetical protein